MKLSNNNSVFVNYQNENTSISDSFFECPAVLTDNLSFAIKNNLLVTYSLGEFERSSINKKDLDKIYENQEPEIEKIIH